MARLLGTGLSIVVLLTAMQAWPSAVGADDAQNVTTFRDSINALNRGDAAGAVNFFADDAQLSGDAPFCVASPCIGKTAIRRQFDFAVAQHAQAQPLSSFQAINGNVVAQLAIRVDAIRAAGFSRINVKDTVTFKGDKISKVVEEPEASDPQTAAFLSFFASQAQGSANPLAILHQQQLDALNRGDLATVMTFFADNATVAIGGCSASPCIGKPAIQQEVQRQLAQHDRVTVLSANVSGTTVNELTQISGDQFGAADIQRVQFAESIQFSGDKIVSVTGQLDLTDPQTVAFLRAQTNISPPNTGDGGLK